MGTWQHKKGATGINKSVMFRQLRHENVIRFIGVCTNPQHLCIITEMCEKGDLFDVIRHYKKPNFAQQVPFQCQSTFPLLLTPICLGQLHV